MMAVTSLPLPAFAADAAAGEEIAISAERFPDERFRNYISEQLDSDGDNMLSATECSEVVDLNVSQQGIADLTGIDVFSKLQQLDCSGNTLSALDISGAAQLLQLNCSANPDLSALKLPEKNGAFSFLVMLDCSDCALTELSLDSYALLGTLDCSGNQLAALDISANSNLRTVDCSGNQLAALDVSANSNLQTVDCSGNQLAALDVSANSNLQTVNCSNNQLTTLNFSQNAKLEEVDCSGNQLTELDVYNALLQKLDCSENALPSLFLSECSALRELDCSQNQLVELDTTGLTLEILETAGNQRAIVPQPERAGAYSYDLNNLPELEQDRITGWENASVKEDAANVLQIPADTERVSYGYRLDSQQAVPVATFTLTLQPDEACYLQLNEEHFPDAAFRSLVRDSFDTDGNSWLSLAELQAAKTLTISADSGITDLTGMEQLCWLENLQCSGISLERLDVSGFSALKMLSCDGCGLKELLLPEESSLEVLSCNQNQLTSLELSRQSNLQELFCADNQLCALQIDGTKLADGTVSADGNVAAISPDILGQLDLSQLSGFSAEQAENWTNGTVQDGVLTVADLSQPVTYTYYLDAARTQTVQFTLQPEELLLPVDAVHFPDSAFRSYVQGLDTNADGSLSRGELFAVTEMLIGGGAIWDLTGIQYFVRLETLDCSANNLRKLDLTTLSQLKTLNCSSNNLSSLVLPENSLLEELRCSSNSTLQELSVASLSHLQVLYCAQCRLKTLDLTNSPELTTLNCSLNQLTSLELDGLSQLTTLNCSMNKLTALDLSALSVLRSLNCASNQIPALAVEQCPELATLNCSNNQLTVLKTESLPNLESLVCINNQLTALQAADGVTLQKLSAARNKCTVAMDSLNRIRFADLAENFQPSRVVQGSITNGEAGAGGIYVTDPGWSVSYQYQVQADDPDSVITFTLVPQAAEEMGVPIDAEHFPDENFRRIVVRYDTDSDGLLSRSELKQVTELDVSVNEIADLTGVEYFTALQTLDCSNNKLTTIPLRTLGQLEKLNCNNNQLTTLDCSANTLLKELSCASNQLTALELSKLTELTKLACEGNQLTVLELGTLTQLQTLDCSGNQLTTLDVSAQKQLETLRCMENHLIALDVTGLSKLQQVEVIDNTRSIPFNAMGQVDLSALADGFQPSQVQPDRWQNATCTENVLTVNDRSQEIRYAYQIDAGDASRTVSFTWIPTVMEEDAVAIDTEHFPDDVLRSYVLQSLDKNGDGMLQISEQKAVTQLDISNCGIADLTGISYFPNLVQLNCAGNSISDLSGISEKLEVLDCSNTALRELNLTDFYRLTELHCRGLHLQSLNVNVLPELQLLDCGENELTSLYLSNLQLEKLICDNNQLTTLDLSRCTALKEVDCRKNQLTGFTWGTVSLRVLNCAENQLNSLNINNQQALEELDCSGNQLGWLMLTNLHQLDMLYAGSNPLLALNLSEQAPMTVCDLQNCVVLKKPSCNRKDLYLEPTQWSGFRLDLVQTWNNAQRFI